VGSLLYPKWQREGPWIESKCYNERESENLHGGGALSRFRVLEGELAKAWATERRLGGGAPLMRGPHKVQVESQTNGQV
jgi:hypothetical protein